MLPETPLPPPPPRGNASISPRRGPWLLWIAIAGLALAWILLGREEEKPAADPTIAEAPAVVSMQTELVGEMTYAFVPMRGEDLSAEMLLMNARPLADSKEWLDRVAWAILVGAIDDPEAGAKALERAAVPEDSKTPELDAALLEAVRGRMPALASCPAAMAEPQDGADLSRLGWYGKLLRNKVEPRPAVVFGLIGFGLWFLACFLAGLVVAVTLVVFAAIGRLRFKLASPAPAARVYGETFVIWMGLFLGFNVVGGLVVGLVLGEDAPDATVAAAGLGAGLAGFLLSLAALAWPGRRGVAWIDVRHDLGLHFGAGFFRETLSGALTYCLALPLLAAGLITYFVLVAIFGQESQPSHPAVEMIGGAGPAMIAGLFVLASLVAPLVEEIAFRGILYRHLRDECGRLGLVASIVIAALASSFLFAVIHPQGVLFAPALMGLAIAFCISRETRGSIWPAMVAHGINNAVTLSLGVTLLGG